MDLSLEQILAEQAAPTLAGLKAASLFSYQPCSFAQGRQTALDLDRAFSPSGIRVLLLKQCQKTGRVLLYVYREHALRELLCQPDTLAFLAREGYQVCHKSPRALLWQLSQRLCLDQDFPHEIGVFLGYPLADVVGFIQNKGHNFTCCGYWKVYGDPAPAQQLFERFRRCTEYYKRRLECGTSITQLARAV